VDTPLGLPEKFLLAVAGALSLATGLLLYIFPARTDLYFAWTIRNPLTAVFIGASYLAGIGTFWALRGGSWREMRVQMPFMLAFGTLQLLATLLNLATFNFGHLLAWAWLAVYAISAPLAWFVFIRNERAHGRAPLQWAAVRETSIAWRVSEHVTQGQGGGCYRGQQRHRPGDCSGAGGDLRNADVAAATARRTAGYGLSGSALIRRAVVVALASAVTRLAVALAVAVALARIRAGAVRGGLIRRLDWG